MSTLLAIMVGIGIGSVITGVAVYFLILRSFRVWK